jgi:hypothetical protein
VYKGIFTRTGILEFRSIYQSLERDADIARKAVYDLRNGTGDLSNPNTTRLMSNDIALALLVEGSFREVEPVFSSSLHLIPQKVNRDRVSLLALDNKFKEEASASTVQFATPDEPLELTEVNFIKKLVSQEQAKAGNTHKGTAAPFYTIFEGCREVCQPLFALCLKTSPSFPQGGSIPARSSPLQRTISHHASACWAQ